MIKALTTAEKLIRLQRENAALKAALSKVTADVEYTAMMCNVELETESEGDEDDQI